MFNKLRLWLKDLLATAEHTRQKAVEPLPPVIFSKISHVEKPPKNEEVRKGRFYFLASGNRPKWVLFQCPCGCGSVITLSLQRMHNPHWLLSNDSGNRPTLHPSVWRDVGCLSHFWVKDGRVFWCRDSEDPGKKRDDLPNTRIDLNV